MFEGLSFLYLKIINAFTHLSVGSLAFFFLVDLSFGLSKDV